MIIKKILISFILIVFGYIFFIQNTSAQFYNSGQDPFSTKWKQINTKNFQLIYPEKYSFQAQQLAKIFYYLYNNIGKSLDHKPRKISIIVHNQTAYANGTVIWAPKRIELYPSIPQTTGNDEWLEALAIHEYRHVVQIDKLNQGISSIIKNVFGEQYLGALVGLYLPLWFLEGDAVVTETALSHSGRGRKPSFLSGVKTQVIDKEIYTYDKAFFGSYKSYVPNFYKMGYIVVSQSIINYSDTIWSKAINNVARKPYMIIPFNFSLKRSSGFNKEKLYVNSYKQYKTNWEKENLQKHKASYNTSLYKKNRYHSDYNFPIIIDSNNIIALKSTLNKIDAFVNLTSYEEDNIFEPGYIFDDQISSNGKYIVWAEYSPHPRWGNKSYSIIKMYDIESGKTKILSSKKRYDAPVINNAGTKIAAVQSMNSDSKISILSSDNGIEIQNIYFKGMHFIHPSWVNDTVLVSIVQKGAEKEIVLIDINSLTFTKLITNIESEVKYPKYSNNNIYYIQGSTGTNNLYKYNLSTKKTHRITDVLYDIANYTIDDNGKIYFANLTADGYKIASMQANITHKLNVKNDSAYIFKIANQLSKKENLDFASENFPDTSFIEKKYRRSTHLLNIHSWAPLYLNIDALDIKTGVSVFSQNKLSTSEISAGYAFYNSTNDYEYNVKWKYSGLFPVIENEFIKGHYHKYYTNSDDSVLSYITNEDKYYTSINIPLSFIHSKWRKYINPSIGYEYSNVQPQGIWEDSVYSGDLHKMKYRLQAQILKKTSKQDLAPKWGIQLNFNYKHTPFQGTQLGSITALQIRNYFPGIIPTHSFQIQTAYQKRNLGKYMHHDIIPFTIGYSALLTKELYKIKFLYKLPILYPDFSIGSLAYIKRIIAVPFCDYTYAKLNGKNKEFSSVGIDIIAKAHFLRFITPFDIGIRSVYLIQEKSYYFQFLLSLDLTGL